MSLASVACGDDGGAGGSSSTASDESTGDAPFDEAAVIEQAGTFATTLVKINAMPFPSQHGLADMVNVYVDAGAADLYRALALAAPVEVDLPEGTLLVKEHLDMAGAYDGYLMMYRGPAGYAPETDDWFWARIDGSGTTQETGPSGAVNFCIGCHTSAPSFVFGVAADNKL
ncbi:MAG: hypothetical protein KDK70_31900 [Myxococcales bacterium]|nr:hypothetical protein [Myxococcales bacterium]